MEEKGKRDTVDPINVERQSSPTQVASPFTKDQNQSREQLGYVPAYTK
jgi:hypothetical protein